MFISKIQFFFLKRYYLPFYKYVKHQAIVNCKNLNELDLSYNRLSREVGLQVRVCLCATSRDGESNSDSEESVESQRNVEVERKDSQDTITRRSHSKKVIPSLRSLRWDCNQNIREKDIEEVKRVLSKRRRMDWRNSGNQMQKKVDWRKVSLF